MEIFKNKNNFVVNGYVLDKEQTKAVICNSKCYLVVASAGSGKTLTIVGKIKYLIEHDKEYEATISFGYDSKTLDFDRSATACVQTGDYSVEKIDNGIRIIYYFDSYLDHAPVCRGA